MARLRSPLTNQYRSLAQLTSETSSAFPDTSIHFNIVSTSAGFTIVPGDEVFLNGVATSQPSPVNFGDRISFGKTVLIFEADSVIVDETRLAEKFEQETYGTSIALPGAMCVVLGREDSPQVIRLNHPSVSRRHARIDRTTQAAMLVDLGSSNGTFVNGVRIHRQTPLTAGDRIGIGPYQFIFKGDRLQSLEIGNSCDGDLQLSQVDLRCSGLTRTVARTGQLLLSNINLNIPSGKFVCILGPSGAGKSTLLRALANRESSGGPLQGSGQVLLNGINLVENFDQLKHKLAFVPQHEILFDDLSLHSSLFYTARLRLPSDLGRQEIEERINNVLKTVQLEDCGSKLVGQLSGGQRKRAALATELLAQPSILFADEVTSGLDEMTDGEVMKLFRNIADNGQSVVCITHSLTYVARECHLLVILTRMGHLAFYGSPTEALKFFNVDSISDIYPLLAVKSSEEAQRLAGRFRPPSTLAAPRNQTGSRPQVQSLPAFAFSLRQFGILLARDWQRLRVDIKSNLLRFMQCAVVALLLCSVFKDLQGDRAAQINCCFILLISCFWFGCNAAAKEVVRERPIFEQERRVGMQPLSYIWSKLCMLTVVASMQAELLLCVVKWTSHLPGSLAAWSLVVTLMALAGSAMGLAISAAARDEQSASAAVPILLIPQIIMAGAVAELTGVNLWLGRCVIAAYSGLQSGEWILKGTEMSWWATDFWGTNLILLTQAVTCFAFSLASLQRSQC